MNKRRRFTTLEISTVREPKGKVSNGVNRFLTLDCRQTSVVRQVRRKSGGQVWKVQELRAGFLCGPQDGQDQIAKPIAGFTRHTPGGFTLIELLVVIAVIALLMAILMPALQRVKKQAKAVVCQTNLRQWALVFSFYMDENNGYFAYGDSSGQWRWVLQAHDRDRKLRVCCPEASNPDRTSGTYGVWGPISLDADYVAQEDYGSYGLNRWVYNRKKDQSDEGYFKGRNVAGTNQIPLFMDCSWYGAGPLHYDNPPEYDGHTQSGTGHWRGDNMRRVCLNRHNAATNSAFLDLSVRRIGLKELWTLEWNRNFQTNSLWTTAGGAVPADWPLWMRSFKDY